MADSKVTVEVEGQTLALSNLDKVMYPETGFTKGEVIDYYVRVAEVLLPHLSDRLLTRRRWPDGTSGQPFFEKNAPRGTPDFVRFRVGIGKPPRKGSQPGRQHVLGRFTKAEAVRLPSVIDGVASALELALDAGMERAMDRYNRPGSLGCEELK